MWKKEEQKGVLVYFQVDDIEETFDKVKHLGGKVILGKTQIPNVGSYGVFSDLDGNQIAIFSDK